MRTFARVLAVPALVAVSFTGVTGVTGQLADAHSHTVASTVLTAGTGTAGGQASSALTAGDGTVGGQA